MAMVIVGVRSLPVRGDMSDEFAEPDFLAVRCEYCEARLRVRAKLAGRTANCPSCGSAIAIPTRPVIEFELPDDGGEPEWLDGSGVYRLATPLQHAPELGTPEPLPQGLQAPAPERGYLEQVERVRPDQDVVESRPKYVFFSGVFDFPWYTEVWPRWVYLALGGILASLIPLLAAAYLDRTQGYAGVGIAFFAMPQIWITLWSGSFMAACGMQVFEDTAAGSDHVTAWPDPNWREWMWTLMHIGYVAVMVLAIAYGTGLVCGGSSRTFWAILAIVEFVLFPICLLSVLEGNNIAILFSPRLLMSLIRRPIGWLLFYLVTGALFVAWGGMIWYVFRISTLLLIVMNGLLYASIGLIWFRLLGRLAWSISHNRTQKRRRIVKASPQAPRVLGESTT